MYKLKLFVVWFFLCSVLLCGIEAEAKMPDWRRCAGLNQTGEFRSAAVCYRQVAASIDPQVSEAKRVRKGYFLREAAKNLEKLAKREVRPEIAGHIRERAAKLLERILTQGLVRIVRGKRRGKSIRVMLGQLRKKIGYTPLAISTGDAKTKIMIKGYAFQAKAVGQFNQSLRPGPYRVQVSYPGEEAREQQVTLRRGRSLVLGFVQKPTVPVISWVGYTVGSAALIGGGVLLTMGLLRNKEAVDCFEDPNCTFSTDRNNQEEFEARQNQAFLLGLGGGIAIAVGIALLAVGGVSHARAVNRDFTKREKSLRRQAMMPRPLRDIGAVRCLGSFE